MHFVRSVVFLSILTLCAALPNAEANRYLQYEIHEAFEEYAGNTENGQIRTARRDTAVIRALHPDDRLPGLSQREVRNLVAMGRESGEPFDVWGVRTRYS